MSEQRLIGIDALKEKEQYIPCGNGLLFHGVTAATIDAMPTIDQETLPIVRELREKLERVTAERNTALKWVKQLKSEKAAAVGELNGVLASVYDLTEFVDDEVHPVVDYDLYLRLRDKVDVITQWEHADEWRGPDGDHT